MHAQGAAKRGDTHQARHVIRQLVFQRMEFVDDHDKSRRCVAHVINIGYMQVGRQLFTAGQFGFQGLERPCGMGQIEIADASDGVGQLLEFAESGTAFEIKENEIKLIRTIHGRQS